MPAQVLSGVEPARQLLAPLAERAGRVLARAPRLVAIRANRDPGTAWYAQAQAKHCAAHGIDHHVEVLDPDTATESALRAVIERHNADPGTDGILLFTPLPPGVDAGRLAAAVAPEKDAEGVHPANLGRLVLEGFDGDAPFPVPCTAMAAVALVRSVLPTLAGQRALVVGRSAIVGKPAFLLLLGLHATVTVGHTRSPDLPALARDADILIAAAGASGARWRQHVDACVRARKENTPRPPAPDLSALVKEDWVKRGAVLVDVGENEIPLHDPRAPGAPDPLSDQPMRRVGDIDRRPGVVDIAGWLTPEKGGVGPLTNAFLLRNVLTRALAAAAR